MNPVYIFIIFQIIFKLQSIGGDMTNYPLLPLYWIPNDDLPHNFTVPAVDECIMSYRYAKEGNKTFIGMNVIYDKFIFTDVNKKFNSDEKCIFHSPSVLKSISMFYTNQDYCLFIVKGCLTVTMKIGPSDLINGTYVFLPSNYSEEFLIEGLSHFNISHTFAKKNVLYSGNNLVNQCLYHNEHCSSYKTESIDCFDDFSENTFLFFYISFLVFIVVFIVAGVWYFSE